MTDVGWVTVGLVGVNIALVIITIRYVGVVRKQLEQSEKAMLLQIRYRLESDITQIRIMKAQLIGRRPGGWDRLEEREKQCKETIAELAQRIERFEKGT